MTTIYQRALFLALLPLAGCGRSKENSAGIPLSYWFVLAPQSADTYRSDLLENLQFAKNIYAPLVSTYMTGKPQGMAAVSWTVDPSGRVWRFKIRRGLVFEDGTPISPDIVLQNFKRIFWLTRKDGLVLNSLLPEVREMKSMRQPLRSAYATSDEVVFQFSKRPLNLFETISQPIYGIAHPKCFDDEGRWEDPWCLCSSGQYQVKFRSANKIVLKSRHVFQEVAGAPEIVEFHAFNKNANVLNALMAGRCDVAHLNSSP
jgi:ABC-type transport system substrate-binding protein